MITATTADGNKTATCTVKVVPNTVFGQTFKLTSVKVYASNDMETPLESEQVPTALQGLSAQIGNTAICESQENGGKYNVKGTCDFGEGALGTLTGDAAYTLTCVNRDVMVRNQYEYDSPYSVSLMGYY
ncbi:MAG: hypothetical protein K2J61_02605, partial [Clostridia bacterium]|nr:hypothetical protein [Clostridia bacterium]